MKRKTFYLMIAGIATLVTIIGSIIAVMLYPPAVVAVALLGGAVITWGVNKALDTISEAVTQTIEIPSADHIYQPTPSKAAPHAHTVIFRKHEVMEDDAGHQITKDTEETYSDDEKLIDRPKRPGLGD